jgi:hypothetical protein
MNDSGRVELGQRTRELTSDGERVSGREQSLSQDLAQGLSFDQLRHQGDNAVVEDKIVDRDEMGVLNSGQHGPLLDEAADEVLMTPESLMEDLDGNLAVCEAVRGAPHRPRSTPADLRDQGVAACQPVTRTPPRIPYPARDHCRKVAAILASACA